MRELREIKRSSFSSSNFLREKGLFFKVAWDKIKGDLKISKESFDGYATLSFTVLMKMKYTYKLFYGLLMVGSTVQGQP